MKVVFSVSSWWDECSFVGVCLSEKVYVGGFSWWVTKVYKYHQRVYTWMLGINGIVDNVKLLIGVILRKYFKYILDWDSSIIFEIENFNLVIRGNMEGGHFNICVISMIVQK